MNARIHHVEVGGPQPYSIAIGAGLLDDGAMLAAQVRGRQALVVSDTTSRRCMQRDWWRHCNRNVRTCR
jgi:N-methylhydantoinase B/oxoprolinase/acetone carboxylase alpha subunit